MYARPSIALTTLVYGVLSAAAGLEAVHAEDAAPTSADGGALLAQTGTPARSASAVQASASSTDELTTITVTATRQERSILDVPVSITAFDQAAIDQFDINTIHDITRLTPGVSFVVGNNDSTVISIRGVATRFGAPTAGIYIDDTPTQIRYFGAGTSGQGVYPTVFDLDRIEVLRGPQGTLFGSGSEGGNIRFVTAQPSLTESSGHARVEAGYLVDGSPSYQVGAAQGGPIVNDVLGFRVSAYIEHDGGWINRDPYPGLVTQDQDANWTTVGALTAALKWAIADNLNVTPAFFYQQTNAGGNQEFWSILSNPSNAQFVTGQLVATPTTDTVALPSLKAEWALGGVTFYSNTAYLNHQRRATSDFTLNLNEILSHNYLGPIAITPTIFENPQRQFTQEFRLQSSDPNARFNWVAGAFYEDLHQKANEIVVSPNLQDLTEGFFGRTLTQVFGTGLLPGNLAYLALDTTYDAQVAGFAQVDFKVIDELTLTAGARYTHSSYSHQNTQSGPFNFPTTGNAESGSENDTTPKFGISYKPNEALLFYASASKGFRPGGANTPVPSATCASDLATYHLTSVPSTYNADSVWSYEVGSKGQGFGGRLQWDSSVYYIKWNDIQTSVILQHCGFPFTDNVGLAVSKGVDLSLRANVADGLTVGTSVGYDNAKFTQTLLNSGTPPKPIISSGDLLQTPPWQIIVYADYTFKTFSGGDKAYFHVDNTTTTGFHIGSPVDLGFDPINTHYNSTNVASARLGTRFNGWDVSLFAKNLFNSHTVTYYQDYNATSPLVREISLTPLTAGVTVLRKY